MLVDLRGRIEHDAGALTHQFGNGALLRLHDPAALALRQRE